MRCLNADILRLFSERRFSQVIKKQLEKKAAECCRFLGSILHHANAFSML